MSDFPAMDTFEGVGADGPSSDEEEDVEAEEEEEQDDMEALFDALEAAADNGGLRGGVFKDLTDLDVIEDEEFLIKAYAAAAALPITAAKRKSDDDGGENSEISKKKCEWYRGERCSAKYSGDGHWYSARVVRLRDGGAVVVRFDGYGDEEEEVDAQGIRKAI